MSDVIKNLSKATMNGEHSHFYGKRPLCGNLYPLTIYFEDDDWFAKHAQDDETVIFLMKGDLNQVV